jgi:hypothetical protein
MHRRVHFRDGKGAASASGSPLSTGKGGLCYTCHSPGHKQANCPSRNAKDRAGDARVAARNFACAVETPVRGASASLPLSQLSTPNDVEGKRDRPPQSNDTSSLSNVYRADGKTRSTCNTGERRMPGHDSGVYAETTPKSQTQQPAVTSQASPVVDTSNAMAYRSARAMVSDHVDTNACNIIADKLSKLNYVPVCIKGIGGVHDALHDSGSEVNLIQRDVLRELTYLPSQGRVKIKGVVGPAVETDVVLLDLSPVATDDNCVNIAPPLREIFAVCDELNERIILTADTVSRLTALKTYESVVVTDNNETVIHETEGENETVTQITDETEPKSTDIVDVHDDVIPMNEKHYEVDSKSADTVTLMNEQINDPSLSKYFDMVRRGNKQFFVRDGLLYRRGKINGNQVEQLCLPQKRVETVLKLAHDMPASGHQAVRRTNDRIAMSFFFPGQLQRVKSYCDSCEVCQMRARERRTDLVPIRPIERHEENFGHLQADIIGPMGNGQYKYALVLTDVQSRYVTAFELISPSAKSVVDKIILHSSYFGLPRYISFDCGTHFTSELTKVCLERLGVSPRFHCPYNPRAAGIVERSNATVKQIISKLVADYPSVWNKLLPFALWSLRTSVNETLGISPYQAVFGRAAIGPLQLLCDDWIGKRPLPLDIAKAPCEYLTDLERKLQIASEYAMQHADREQTRYTHAYNLRSRDKSFQVGERVIYLMPSSTHKLTRTWQGPCVVVKKNSPYSYVIEFDGKQQWCHANNLRKYNDRVIEVSNHNCAIIFDCDRDFGVIPSVKCSDLNTCDKIETQTYRESGLTVVDDEIGDVDGVETSLPNLCDGAALDVRNPPVSCPESFSVLEHVSNELCDDQYVGTCSLPSTKIDRSKLTHLSADQQHELLEILDEFAECFAETPGFCPYVEHDITIDDAFRPKRLREYRIPEILKPEVQRQIDELLKNGFIRPSNSPMASPIVAVLKGPSGSGGVRLAIDYRFVNLHSCGDAFVMPHLLDSIQRVGTARYISVFDARSGYWQLGMKEECKWLTAFAYEGGLYEWNRLPFGLKSSGNTFCRCVQMIVHPIRHFCFPFVDDMSVCSESWTQHLSHVRSFLNEIRKSGLTLSLKKCSLAQPEVRFVGHIIGSGRHRPDESKLATIANIAKPVTKKDVRKMIGFFNYFHCYVPRLAELCVAFTNLLAKGKPNIIVWTPLEEQAFEQLKVALSDCVRANLFTAEWGKPFGIHCDSSKIAVGSCLVQWDPDGVERPIAFASAKLSGAQLSWAAIEKEAYAIIWSLNKFRTWIFGAPITLFVDANPLTYLTASAPKSAKLTRWALALQEFNVSFQYRKGREHVVPDYLSRPN